MPILKTVSEKAAKGKVKKVFDDIKKVRNISKIPNFWRTIASDPASLERTWKSLKQEFQETKSGNYFLRTRDIKEIIFGLFHKKKIITQFLQIYVSN